MIQPHANLLIALVTLTSLRGVRYRVALWLAEKLRQLDENRITPKHLHTSLSQVCRGEFSTESIQETWQTSGERIWQGGEQGIRPVSIFDDDYPPRLKGIPTAPLVLFVKGNTRALHHERSVAIVGTRKPTELGIKVTVRYSHAAVEAGFSIVSGLALGCDRYAHRACLRIPSRGVAVLAHGLDRVYPMANRALADEIIEKDGCWVSEYPVGYPPNRWNFVARNRIQSGLADATFVVETSARGGTMHTARFAHRQDRLLACSQHHEESSFSGDALTGNRQLIENGWASPISGMGAWKELLQSIPSRESNSLPTMARRGHIDDLGEFEFA